MCWSKVLKFWVPVRTLEACLQKALTFLMERVFSRELREYRRNPVVHCRHFGISKPGYYYRCNCDTICSRSFNFNITFLNVDLCQGQDNKPRDRKFALLHGKTEWFRLASFMACLRILSCRYSDISLEAFLLREFRTSGTILNDLLSWAAACQFLLHVYLPLVTKHLVFSSMTIIQMRLEYFSQVGAKTSPLRSFL